MEVYGSGLEITLIIFEKDSTGKCRAVNEVDRFLFHHNITYSTVHTK